MKTLVRALFITGFCFLLSPAPVSAEINTIEGDGICVNPKCQSNAVIPVLQGETARVTIAGRFVDLSTEVQVTGSGVTASYGTRRGGSNSSIDINLTVAGNAEPGTRTVKMRYAIEASGPDTFTIRVVRKGRVTDVDVPAPTAFFNQVDVTLTGENIGNAKAVLENTNPSNVTAQVTENTNSRAVVRLNFGSQIAQASLTIRLLDNDCGTNCLLATAGKFFYAGLNDFGRNPVEVVGPNAVSSITFPDGNRVSPGSVFTIQINLVRPARNAPRKGPISISTIKPVFGSAGGEIVHWQLVPSNVFTEAPGSGISFSPTGLNQVRIPPGDTLIRLKVRLTGLPSGCNRECTGKIETRMGNINTDQSPFFKTETFTFFDPLVN